MNGNPQIDGINRHLDEEEKRKRREKFKQWREQKRQKLDGPAQPGSAGQVLPTNDSPGLANSEVDTGTKALSMRERMELWRKQRQQQKHQDANGAASPSASPPPPPEQASAEHKVAEIPPKLPSSKPRVTPQKLGNTSVDAFSRLRTASKSGTRLAPPSLRTAGTKPRAQAASVFGETDEPFAKSGVTSLGRKVALSRSEDGNKDTNKPGGFAERDSQESEIDPLDMYMQDVSKEMRALNQVPTKASGVKGASGSAGEREFDEDQGTYGNQLPDDPDEILAMAAKKFKKKDIIAVDHSKVDYPPFRKAFYIEPPELRDISQEDVELLREELDGIKIRGKDCPKPATKWSYFGLPAACIEVIKWQRFECPTPIQAQAIPAILSGRDVIGVAKTGSGKTLAFLLPMLRQIKAQPLVANGEGPIALIMTPTRELAAQIYRECKLFSKPLGLRAVCAYGGSPIKDQIADLKRGAEIVVCTPGRMIDLLCANSGRVTNLKRITYLVLDEADRMFDMGFEPQVMKIVQNVRPDRQTVLFSATFPRQMEALARKILKRPLEITVGGRSVVCQDVDQRVLVVPQEKKFLQLLEILGRFYNDDPDTLALVFVDRQESADFLFRDLLRRGYVCGSIHGGKDQLDRNQTISDFKAGNIQLLIATSVAARGLDVKKLALVINYDCPNHMEDYVHRVGRTGRAGNKGVAYTFITPEQDRYAVDIVNALNLSDVVPPKEVADLANSFLGKVERGEVTHYNPKGASGFGGKGLERLDQERDMVKQLQRRAYGGEEAQAEDEEGEEEIVYDSEGEMVEVRRKLKPALPQPRKPIVPTTISSLATTTTTTTASAAVTAAKPDAESSSKPTTMTATMDPKTLAALKAAEAAAKMLNVPVGSSSTAVSAVDEINAQFSRDRGDAGPGAGGGALGKAAKDKRVLEYSIEIEINDYPQRARWRVTSRETLSQLTENTGVAITTRGIYVVPGKPVPDGERKLHLLIEGESERAVDQAKQEIRRLLAEATMQQMERESRQGGLGGSVPGRYSVV